MTGFRWTTLSKVNTGFIIAHLSHHSFDERWSAVTRAVAEEFECDADILSCQESDEGREFVALNGKPIVEIHDGYISRTADQIDQYRAIKAHLALRDAAENFLLAHHRHDNCYEAGLEKLKKAASHLGFELKPTIPPAKKEAA